MKDCKVYPISKLPFYSVENSATLEFLASDLTKDFNQSDLPNIDDAIDKNVAPSFENETIAKNNKRNTLVGNLGEEIAQAYLSTKYSKVKRIALEKSNEGYDIVAQGILCYEVKTSTAKNFEFEITVNELRTANEKQQDYHLFYIAVDTCNKTALGFIFCNPVKKFGIDFDTLTQQISIFEPTRFHGKLQEYICLSENVDLTKFLAKVLDKKPEYEELFTKMVEKLGIAQLA